MQIELTKKQYRRLLDLVYIGNWVLNSTRGTDRFSDYEAIGEYEDAMFFDILAEELARRDMNDVPIDESNFDELVARVEAYLAEFELHGTDNVQVTTDD